MQDLSDSPTLNRVIQLARKLFLGHGGVDPVTHTAFDLYTAAESAFSLVVVNGDLAMALLGECLDQCGIGDPPDGSRGWRAITRHDLALALLLCTDGPLVELLRQDSSLVAIEEARIDAAQCRRKLARAAG